MTYQDRVKKAVTKEHVFIDDNTGGDQESAIVMNALGQVLTGVIGLMGMYQKAMEQCDEKGETNPTLDALVEWEEAVLGATAKVFNVLFEGE